MRISLCCKKIVILSLKKVPDIQTRGNSLVLTTRIDGLGDGGDGSRAMVVVDFGDGVRGEIAEDGDVYCLNIINT